MTRVTEPYTAHDLDVACEWFDWAELLEEQNITAYVRGDELVASCPYCHHSGRESFFLNSLSGLFFCHVCGVSGGPVKAVASIANISYSDAIARILRGRRYRPLEVEDEELEFIDTTPLINLPDEYLPLTGDTSVASERYRKYLRGRGIDADLVQQYEIGFCAIGHLAGYVIIPVYHLGQLVTFIARAASRTPRMKVWTPPGNSEGDYLFNLDHIWGAKTVVVMEGVFDALVMPDCAVATFGKKISNAQLLNLRAAGVTELIFCWDSDAASEVIAAAYRTASMFNVRVVTLPDGSDPSELGSERMRALVQQAAPLVDEFVGVSGIPLSLLQ